MISTAPQDIAFAPFLSTRFIQTGTTSPKGVIPQDLGTPPQLYWVRSGTGFADLGYTKSHPSSSTPAPADTTPTALGDPDFSRHDVLFLTMGVQGTTGYSLRLERIQKTGNEVRFLLKTKRPAPGMRVGEALTHPGTLVTVDKLPKEAHLVMILDGKEAGFQQKILE